MLLWDDELLQNPVPGYGLSFPPPELGCQDSTMVSQVTSKLTFLAYTFCVISSGITITSMDN